MNDMTHVHFSTSLRQYLEGLEYLRDQEVGPSLWRLILAKLNTNDSGDIKMKRLAVYARELAIIDREVDSAIVDYVKTSESTSMYKDDKPDKILFDWNLVIVDAIKDDADAIGDSVMEQLMKIGLDSIPLEYLDDCIKRSLNAKLAVISSRAPDRGARERIQLENSPAQLLYNFIKLHSRVGAEESELTSYTILDSPIIAYNSRMRRQAAMSYRLPKSSVRIELREALDGEEGFKEVRARLVEIGILNHDQEHSVSDDWIRAIVDDTNEFPQSESA